MKWTRNDTLFVFTLLYSHLFLRLGDTPSYAVCHALPEVLTAVVELLAVSDVRVLAVREERRRLSLLPRLDVLGGLQVRVGGDLERNSHRLLRLR